MLWMLVCAAVFWLGLNEFSVLLLSVFLVAATHGIIFIAIQNCAADSSQKPWPYQGLYLALIISQPAYITWMTITLMDTALWGLMIAAMTYAVISPPLSRGGRTIAAMPFVLAPICRPEGMLVAPILLGLVWFRSQPPGLRAVTRFCIKTGLALLVMIAALTIFRLLYFGYPLPNTFYAKVSPSIVYNLRSGSQYLHGFAGSSTVVYACVAIVLLAITAWLGGVAGRIRSNLSLKAMLTSHMKGSAATSFAALGLLLVPVLTGGDHFGMFRFFQPAYPLLCLTLILVLSENRLLTLDDLKAPFLQRTRKIVTISAAGVVLGYWLFAFSSSYSWRGLLRASPIGHEFRVAEDGTAQGKRLKTLFAQGQRFPAIGVIKSGGIARGYPGPIVDLMGLNNAAIAHFKGERKGMKNHAAFEKDPFFMVEPDVLLVSPPVPPETTNFGSGLLKGLLDDPRFTARWRSGVLSLSDDPSNAQEVFVKTTFLEDMPPETKLEFRETMIWLDKWVAITTLPEQPS